jgi:sugar phosphate isomerase/epimerase
MPLALSEYVFQGPAAERFRQVQDLQADGLELRFGPHDFEQHLLWQPEGPRLLRSQAQAAGVGLSAVYAGYFHQFPLSVPDPAARQRHSQVLDQLLERCAEAGVAVLVLPLFGTGELQEEAACHRLGEALLSATPKAVACQLTLALETTLPAAEIQTLLTRWGSSAVGVAFDVGNAAFLGYDVIADCQLLGPALCQVRVKDHSAQGQRVPLGQGSVPMAALVQALRQRRFAGWWVLETPAGADASTWARAEVAALRRLLGD